MPPEGINIHIPYVPVPKGRPRFAFGHAYSPRATRAFEAACALYAAQAMHDHQLELVRKPECLQAVLLFSLPVPKSWSVRQYKTAVQGAVQPAVKPDLDNLIKSVLDGLNGIVFEDDAQITRLTAAKTYGAAPGVDVYITSGSTDVKAVR